MSHREDALNWDERALPTEFARRSALKLALTSHEAPARACLTYDLLDRGSIFGACKNGVRIFPPQISLVLNALGDGEQIAPIAEEAISLTPRMTIAVIGEKAVQRIVVHW